MSVFFRYFDAVRTTKALPLFARATATSAVALTVLLAGPLAQAQSLAETLAQVYQTNPQLAAERERLAALDEQFVQAKAFWRPSLTAEASIGILDETVEANDSTFVREQTREPMNMAVNAQQFLYRGGRTEAEMAQAMNDIRAARANLLVSEQQLLLEAATAYVDVLQSLAELQLNESNEEVLTKNLSATQDRFDVGDVTVTDVAQAEARLARIEADVVQARGELNKSKVEFQRVTALRPGQLRTPKLSMELPVSLEVAEEIALRRNPEIVRRFFERQASVDNIKLQQGFLLPEVQLEGQYSYAENPSSFTSSIETASATARVSVPIFQRGITYSRIRQARREAAQAKFVQLDQQRTIRTLVSQAWEDLVTADARTEALAAEIKASEVALGGVRQESLVGTRTVLEVLDSEQEFLSALVEHTLSQRNQVVARFKLMAAIGRLNVKDLGLTETLGDGGIYNPDLYLDAVDDKWIGGKVEQSSNGLPTGAAARIETEKDAAVVGADGITEVVPSYSLEVTPVEVQPLQPGDLAPTELNATEDSATL